jgi:hypothetical protein
MASFIPIWIIGAPFIGVVLLSFMFGGSSAMGGSASRSYTSDGRTIDGR